MKCVKKLLIACGLAGLYAGSLYGQGNPYKEVSIASPTAASLGKYADIPINYHTGIPQISIPIYTVKEGPLSLPINLNYHASGLKVMEPASWVGAGWSLEAGGVITRTVQGAPDEKGTSTVSPHTHGYFSDFGYSNYYFFQDNTTQCQGGYNSYASEILRGIRDGEPDLFFFNFCGYSGKFYFRDDRTTVLVPEQDMKIEYDYSGSGSIGGFILTTPEGTRYYFGRTPSTTDTDPIEKTNPYTDQSGQSSGQAISSWYLNKIVSADGVFSISLSYEPENYGYYTISMFPLLYSDNTSYEYRLLKNIINGVRLSQISFSNGTVSFLPGSIRTDLNSAGGELTDAPNTEAKCLAGIQLSGSDGVCKKYEFTYSYFEDNTTSLKGYLATAYSIIQSDRKRLKLEKLQEKTCNGTISIPAHVFEYYNELVPRRLTFAQDHWGFYNGAVTNQKLIPTYTVDKFNVVEGANRDPKWPEMRGGALKKIIYPTGGSAEFEFEPHTTWISTNKYKEVGVTGASMGYDGNTAPVTWTKTLSGNYHRFSLSNSSAGGSAGLTIKNLTTAATTGLNALPGETRQTVLNLGAGNYQFTLNKTNSSTGNGASADVSEQVSYPYTKNDTIGGLRIKTIIRHNAMGSSGDTVTSFTYSANGVSTGILYSRPTYVQIYRNEGYKLYGYADGSQCSTNGCDGCDNSVIKPYYKSPCTGRPMETTQGSHIGYNEVTVTQAGNGHSVYRYYGSNWWDNNHDDVAYRNVDPGICDPAIPNFPAAPLPHEFMRGELKYEGHFNESGQLLKNVWYYPVFLENPVTTPGLIIASAGGHGSYPTYYELKTGRKTQVKTETTTLVPGIGNVTEYAQSFFESPYHHQPTRKLAVDSWGDTLKTLIKYAADFRVTNCDTISDCFSQYTTAIANYTTQFYSAVGACANGDGCCKFAAYNVWMARKGEARNAYINCRRTNFTNSTNAYGTCMTNAKTAAGAELKPVLELRDVFNNAPIEISDWKADKLLGASFSKYDYSTNPATKVYPVKLQKINLATPATVFSPVTNSATALSKDSRYEDESSARFINGNIVEITPKEGVPTSYIWGYNNNLPIVKAMGVDYATLKTAYDAVSGNLSQIRNQSSLAGKPLSTYTYNPLAGMVSETGATNRTTYYEYDGLLRLQRIRDHDNNIVKQFDYQYQAPSHGHPIWVTTGNTRCKPCAGKSNYTSNILQQEEKDTNPQSDSYNQSRWTDVGASSTCVVVADWQNTGTVQCLTDGSGYRTGIQRIEQKDMNPCSPTYNQLRNQDISNTVACTPNAPNWQNTGTTRCKPCAVNGSYLTDIQQNEQKDNNPNSSTYNQIRWVDAGPGGSCVINADWQNTATAIRCRKDAFNQNTGEQEQEQKDMNPCSLTYNTLRWVVIGVNRTACPSFGCNPSRCTGNDQKCLNNLCEIGQKVYTSSTYNQSTLQYECTFHYEWSDGSWSQNFVESQAHPCPI